MNIREIMTTGVSTAAPDTTVEEIATIMKREDIGAIPIIEDGELCGVLTDRDIVVRCVAEGKNPADTRAEDILSEDLHVIEVDDDVDEAAELMSREQIRRLPVVENGRLVGILSIGDIAVKEGDDRTSGDTLQGISRGVKPSTGKARKATSGKKPDSAARNNVRDAATRGRDIKPNRQGITNRSAGEETKRNERVIPFRDEARSSSRKPATRKKAG
jgi:CBS domain-containing protein